MPTAACGIDCDVCKLRLMEICSTCGPGKSADAQSKLETQKRILGNTCPILDCAVLNQIDYCMRDCELFPCNNFELGYPFSEGFLRMQSRRLAQIPPARSHINTPVEVPQTYWELIQDKSIPAICNCTLTEPFPDNSGATGVIFRFLNEDILVDFQSRMLKRRNGMDWEQSQDPLLELVSLVYFGSAKSLLPLSQDIVSPNDLKEGHFFQGPHELKTAPLLERYGHDPEAFSRAALALGGTSVDMADRSYMLLPFPRIPLYYLFWEGDQEFAPDITILMDRSIEAYLAADAIWGLVNRVSQALLQGPAKMI